MIPTLVHQRTSRPRIYTKITERSIPSVSERLSRAAGKTKKDYIKVELLRNYVYPRLHMNPRSTTTTSEFGLWTHLVRSFWYDMLSTRDWSLIERWRRFIAGVLVHEIELVIPREGGRMLAFSRFFFGFIYSYSNLAFVFGILVIVAWMAGERDIGSYSAAMNCQTPPFSKLFYFLFFFLFLFPCFFLLWHIKMKWQVILCDDDGICDL